MPEEYPLFTPTSDDRVLAMLSHLLAIIGGLGLIAPLIIWLIKKDDPNASFVTENAKESLNFQITVIILAIVFCVLLLVFIGFPLMALLGVAIAEGVCMACCIVLAPTIQAIAIEYGSLKSGVDRAGTYVAQDAGVVRLPLAVVAAADEGRSERVEGP